MINYLQYIINKELWRTNPLLPMRQFLKYCKDRKISTKKEHLIQLEKLGIFYPVARRLTYYTEDNVEESDAITDEMRHDPELCEETFKEKYIPFYFSKDIASDFFENGLLWQPSILKKKLMIKH